MDGGDDAAAQGLPPAHHHVDHPTPTEHRLDDLLPVLIGQVHVIYLQ